MPAARGAGAHPHRHRLAGLGRSATSRASAKRVIVLGGGNTAMDCCRRSARAWAADVKVIVRSRLRRDEGLAVGKEDAPARGHPDPQLPCRLRACTNGKLTGMEFREGQGRDDAQGRPQPGAHRRRRFVADGDEVLVAIGSSARKTPSPGSSATAASSFDKLGPAGARRDDVPVHHAQRLLRRRRRLRPKNIITAVAHGHGRRCRSTACSRRGRRRRVRRPAPT